MKKIILTLLGFVMSLGMILSTASIAKATPVQVTGSVKTVAYCGQQGNVNPFDEGATVYGEGSNFTANANYRWTVTKVDMPSQGTEVSNGTFHLGANETSFCIVIYKPALGIGGDAHSEFKWEVEQQLANNTWHKVDSDNFFVDEINNQFQPLAAKADCRDTNGYTKWVVSNPNNVNIDITWELYLLGGSPVKESGSGTVLANSQIEIETNTPGDVKLTVYWIDPATLSGKPKTLHLCVNNVDVKACAVTTPTPTPGGGKGGGKTKISPQILGTSTASPITEESLPAAGANISYTWLYIVLAVAALGSTYYLKVSSLKKSRR